MEETMNDPVIYGLLMLLVVLGMAGVVVTLFHKPKCKRHGTVLEEEPYFEEGLGSYDGTYGVTRYCVQCREEEKNERTNTSKS